jgi:hypothetical protein
MEVQMTRRILLVDGDLMVYRNAAAAEERKVLVTHLSSGREKEFDTRTAFKKFLSDKGFPYDSAHYKFEDLQYPLPLFIAHKIIDNMMAKLEEAVWPDETRVYLGKSGGTHRHSLPLPSPYKANRQDSIKPHHLENCKSHLIQKYNAVTCEAWYETDDVLTIEAYAELRKGNSPIIATIDKDAYQTVGVDILNWNVEPLAVHRIPALGEIYQDKAQWKGEGIKFLCFQAIAGDNTDTYCGYDLSKVKTGPTKLAKLFNETATEAECLRALIREYKRLYPDPFDYITHTGQEIVGATWKDMLKLYWKCAYMLRSWADKGDFEEFALHYGVRLDED